jgi:imidazole glycerol-phosphate synthase subunit HisF
VSLKIRLIPCLLLKGGLIVRSELFKYHQIIGDPITQLDRYNKWSVDELIYLDIGAEESYDVRRNDAKIYTAGKRTLLEIIDEISRHCYAPLTFGGKIRAIDDMHKRFEHGADKISINTIAIDKPSIISEAAKTFGSQAIVVSIDVKKHQDGRYEVYKGGHTPTGLEPVKWAREVNELGAGEILLNSIDRDGMASGYDIELIKQVTDITSIPVIALGGAGGWGDMAEVISKGKVAAVAAANIFHFTEMSYKQAKKFLHETGINVRMPLKLPKTNK